MRHNSKETVNIIWLYSSVTWKAIEKNNHLQSNMYVQCSNYWITSSSLLQLQEQCILQFKKIFFWWCALWFFMHLIESPTKMVIFTKISRGIQNYSYMRVWCNVFAKKAQTSSFGTSKCVSDDGKIDVCSASLTKKIFLFLFHLLRLRVNCLSHNIALPLTLFCA